MATQIKHRHENLATMAFKEPFRYRDFINQVKLFRLIRHDPTWRGETRPVFFNADIEGAIAVGKYPELDRVDPNDTSSSNRENARVIKGEIKASDRNSITTVCSFNEGDLNDLEAQYSVALGVKPYVKNTMKQAHKRLIGAVSSIIGTQAGNIAKLVGATTGFTGGNLTWTMPVDKVYLFNTNMRIVMGTDGTHSAGGRTHPLIPCVVTEVNRQNKTIKARFIGSFAGSHVAVWNPADNVKIWLDFTTNLSAAPTATQRDSRRFNSIPRLLLSATNGGDANIHGQVKTSHYELQAYNYDGSTILSAFDAEKSTKNLFTLFLDALNENFSRTGKVPTHAVMSYSLATLLRHTLSKDHETGTVFDGNESRQILPGISMVSVGGNWFFIWNDHRIIIYPVDNFDDDLIAFIDSDAFVFLSNGNELDGTYSDVKKIMGEPVISPYKFYTKGHVYFKHITLLGELQCHAPSDCFIVHKIPYTALKTAILKT